MRVTITDEKRQRRRNSGKAKKNNNWFPAWQAKKKAAGTWKDEGGKKK